MKCGKIMKFDSVMFGEPIPKDVLNSSRDSINYADCVLSIGTSSTVRPAAGLFWIAKSQNAKLIEINISPTTKSPLVLSGALTSESEPQAIKVNDINATNKNVDIRIYISYLLHKTRINPLKANFFMIYSSNNI